MAVFDVSGMSCVMETLCFSPHIAATNIVLSIAKQHNVYYGPRNSLSRQIMKQLQPLSTVREVIDALGGAVAVQALTEAKSTQVVSNWIARGTIASHAYPVMIAALQEKGSTAPATLWGAIPPAEPVNLLVS